MELERVRQLQHDVVIAEGQHLHTANGQDSSCPSLCKHSIILTKDTA